MGGKQILMLLGGTHHDFDGFSDAMTPILRAAGHEVKSTYDLDEVLRLPSGQTDVVLIYTALGGSVQDERVAEDLTPDQTRALISWVRAGGGILAAHCATVVAEDNVEMRRLLGGRFLSHPPQFTFTVYPLYKEHPVIKDVDAFTAFDEFYVESYEPDVDIHMVAFDRGIAHPMVWTRSEGNGRVVHLAPGHTPMVWASPAYQKLVLQSIDWLA